MKLSASYGRVLGPLEAAGIPEAVA